MENDARYAGLFPCDGKELAIRLFLCGQRTPSLCAEFAAVTSVVSAFAVLRRLHPLSALCSIIHSLDDSPPLLTTTAYVRLAAPRQACLLQKHRLALCIRKLLALRFHQTRSFVSPDIKIRPLNRARSTDSIGRPARAFANRTSRKPRSTPRPPKGNRTF